MMKPFIAYVAIISILISPAGSVSWAGVATAAVLAAESTTPTPTPPGQPADGGWPRAYEAASGARFVLYEPQVASWPEQKHIVLYSAVSYAPMGSAKAALGTIRVEADTKVAVPERLVGFSEFTITSSNFPTLSREEVSKAVAEINSSVPRNERVLGLDRVLAAIDTSQITPKNVSGLKADPPAVFYSQRPAVVVNIDGAPIWSPIKENELRFAVNTNWDLFEYPPTKSYYLRVDNSWMKAQSIEGPWTTAELQLPVSFSKLPDDDNWKEVKTALRGHKAAGPAPTVFISTKPAELILLTGAPQYVPVQGTRLLWLSNTESDVFKMVNDGTFYYLVSGRWFTAPGFAGPWTFATPNLPDDFKRIPLEHPRSRVLGSVPGTTQALEAVLLAQVPQTAIVNRAAIRAPEVMYQGEPRFESIERTNIARAVNTDKDIVKVGDLYYMCFDGVWFVARGANGPWTAADSIPKEIYEIPISSPAYPVTQVTVESYDDDEVVFAAAAAYTGMMVGWGCAVWGTGWYYPPYYWGGGYYPVYYPGYPSYGYGARYNPWTGAYSRGGAVYGPYGGAGYAARYNPGTGTYSRGAAAWGPSGGRGVAEAWNPRTGTYAQTRQGSGAYRSWGSTAVTRGDQWAATSRVTNKATGSTTRVTGGSGGGAIASRNTPRGGGAIGTTGGGNVYAGRDGNVYRNQGGGWQQYDSGGWKSVERPVGTTGERGAQAREGLSATTVDQLNRDRSSRVDGAQRTRDLGQVSRPSGSSRSGSYRPSGGGFRGGYGGGGFRGGGRR